MSFEDITIVRQYNIIDGEVQTDRYGSGPLAGILAIPGVSLAQLTVHNQKWVETIPGGVINCCEEPPATTVSNVVVDTVVETTPGTPDWPPVDPPGYPSNPCVCPYDQKTFFGTTLEASFLNDQGQMPYIAQEQCGCSNSFATATFTLIADTGRGSNCYWSGTAQNGDFMVEVYFDEQLCAWIITLYCIVNRQSTAIWQGISGTRDGVYATYIPNDVYWCAGIATATVSVPN